MNVLIVGPSKDSQGGISTVINNLYNNFRLEGVTLFFFETWKEGTFFQRLINSVIIIPRFIYIISRLKIEIVHLHVAQKGSFFRKSILALLAKIFNKRVILHIHASQFDIFYNNSSKLVKSYIRLILKICDIVLVLSEEWREIINNIVSREIIILPNAVDVKNNQYTLTGKNITFIGRLGERKGVYDLINIIDPILEKYPGINFYLCGDGEVDKVRKIIRDSRFKDNIFVTGWLRKDEKELILKDTIINILPSYHEGMPMAILETMALGIPNIATDVGGISKVINHLENGIMIKPGDKKALYEGIIALLQDKKLRERLSHNAHKTIKDKYSIICYNKKLKDIYMKLLEK